MSSSGDDTKSVPSQTAESGRARQLLQEACDRSNVCSTTHDFHLQHQKFSIIWPGGRVHRARSRTSFSGGYSTLVFENGRRKLQRSSRNSSNEVFSKKSHLRMAKSFTTFLRFTCPLFSNGHRGTLLLTQIHKIL